MKCVYNPFLPKAENTTPIPCYQSLREVLGCFIKHEDNVFRYKFIKVKIQDDVTIQTYQLTSQVWPIGRDDNIPSTSWSHELNLFIPSQIKHDKALLYVAGGYNKDQQGHEQFTAPKEMLNYLEIASNNQIVVIELQDVPNQYLVIDGQAKKEDQILAYTYKKVMENPMANAFLAGHLPMAKSIVKALDATQSILSSEHQIDIDGFIVAGASKRGWAVWLATLEDERIKAIIPMVIDILNVQKSIIHICNFYKEGCPYALRDYHAEGITEMIKSEAFAQLMMIEDPFNYLNIEYNSKYLERMSIEKYIINSANDDFFVPDSSKWYFKELPGNSNHIRYIPNAMHYFKGNPIADAMGTQAIISDAVNSYIFLWLNNFELPIVKWEFDGNQILLNTSMIPDQVYLWVAYNQDARDFRLINDYSFWHLLSKKIQSYFTNDLGDTYYFKHQIKYACQEGLDCKLNITLPAITKGWQASFIELNYKLADMSFVLTSEVYILTDIQGE